MLAPTDPHAITAALGNRLCAKGVLEPAQLARAKRVAEETNERLDLILCRLGIVHEALIADTLAEIMALPRIEVDAFPEEPLYPDKLNIRFLKSTGMLAVSEDTEAVDFAITDPFDRTAADALARRLGKPIRLHLATASEVEAALDQLYATGEADTGVTDIGTEDTAADVARLKDLASEAPVIRIVNALIRQAVEVKASDIHIEPFQQRLRVRLRIDGRLGEIEAPPAELRAAVISRLKIMAKLNIAEQRMPQDGRIQIAVAGREIDLRVATVPTLQGEGVVLRLLDRSGLVLSFEGLGFDQAARDAFLPLIERPNGILLVTGPTGSGKTTTLYAALSHINTPARKIITIEDPVEYQLAGITQIQVKSQIGLSFAHGLRSILRQDPDVIMIGEIRDTETAQIAVQAALTGHLVLATLHTNSAAAAINRLRDMGVEDYLITATLQGVLAQRLVRRLCPDCAVPADPAGLARILPDRDPQGFREPVGCAKCRNSGFRGRTGLVEVLAVTQPIRHAILNRTDLTEIEACAQSQGMRMMRDHGVEKAASGETALTEVLRVAVEG